MFTKYKVQYKSINSVFTLLHTINITIRKAANTCVNYLAKYKNKSKYTVQLS